jgi:hypothetical protein
MSPAGPKTSQMAVWAMVTGIISMLCCQFLGPLPIILGAVALAQIRSHPQEQGSGFAIAGIVMGVLALLVFVACLIFFISFPQYLTNFQNSFSPPQ